MVPLVEPSETPKSRLRQLNLVFVVYVANKRIRIIYEFHEGKLLVDVIAIGEREAAKVYAVADAEMKTRRLRRIS